MESVTTTDRKISAFAVAACICVSAFPAALLATADRHFLVNPWEAIPLNVFRSILLLPVAAVVLGHLAGRDIRRNQLRGGVLKRVSLVLGYLGVVATPFAASRYAHPIFEASAVGSLRTIHSAAEKFVASHPKQGFPARLDDMCWVKYGSRDCDWCLDETLCAGRKSAYLFTYVPRISNRDTVEGYDVFADPIYPRNPYTRRHFFIDQSGTIRMDDRGRATASSRPLL